MDRYHRQQLLPMIGEAGQRNLRRAHALIVGCGALGCASADLLTRAGVGTITIVDRDLVEVTNLQRQFLFDEHHVRAHTPKAVAASDRLGQINSEVRTIPIVADFSSINAESIALGNEQSSPDIILDGTDNYETRFLINDLAVKHSIPYAYAGAVSTHAMSATFLAASHSPCLRCVFDGPPPPGSQPTCDTAGVLGPVISMVAGVQAAEAMKVLVGAAGDVRDSLLEFDAWANRVREIALAPLKDKACPCCAQRRFSFLDATASDPVAICGRDALQISPPMPRSGIPSPRIDLALLADRLRQHGPFDASRFLVRGSLSQERAENGEAVGLTVFSDGRAIVQGVTDPSRARSIYSRYIGG